MKLNKVILTVLSATDTLLVKYGSFLSLSSFSSNRILIVLTVTSTGLFWKEVTIPDAMMSAGPDVSLATCKVTLLSEQNRRLGHYGPKV